MYSKDRLRRTLVLRYRPQAAIPEILHDRLSSQTRELMAHYTHVKEVVKEDVVWLT